MQTIFQQPHSCAVVRPDEGWTSSYRFNAIYSSHNPFLSCGRTGNSDSMVRMHRVSQLL